MTIMSWNVICFFNLYYIMKTIKIIYISSKARGNQYDECNGYWKECKINWWRACIHLRGTYSSVLIQTLIHNGFWNVLKVLRLIYLSKHVIHLCRDHFQACLDFRRQLIESKKVGQNIRGELSLSSGCGRIQREVNSLTKELQGFFWTDSLATIDILPHV